MNITASDGENQPGFGARPAFQLTILESVGPPINKQIKLNPDGTLDKKNYRHAYLFTRHLSVPIDSIEALAAELERIQADPYRCVVMGKPCGPIPLEKPARRLKHTREEHLATLEDQAVGFLPIDIDNLIVADLDVIGDPEGAVEAAIERLGSEFENVSCWWQFTSGQKPAGNELRLRLFFILTTPLELAVLKHWGDVMEQGVYDHKNECWLQGRIPVDPSIYQCHQPIYVATPTFGSSDPRVDPRDHLPRRSGLLLREHDTVALIIPDQPPTPTYARGDTIGTAVGPSKLLKLIGDHPGGKGFYNPIRDAIMSLVNQQWPEVAADAIKALIRQTVQQADLSRHNAHELADRQSDATLDDLIQGGIKLKERELRAKYPELTMEQIAGRIRQYRKNPPQERPSMDAYSTDYESGRFDEPYPMDDANQEPQALPPSDLPPIGAYADGPAAQGQPSTNHKPKSNGGENRRNQQDKTVSIANVVCMSDVQTEAIQWLWKDRIARGKVTLIAGDPGLGKSMVTVGMAATVSCGGKWPVDSTDAPIGDVIMLSAEDDPADTIRPRLDAAGADVSRVFVVEAIKHFTEDGMKESPFNLKEDLQALEQVLQHRTKCRLLIIDPLSAYL